MLSSLLLRENVLVLCISAADKENVKKLVLLIGIVTPTPTKQPHIHLLSEAEQTLPFSWEMSKDFCRGDRKQPASPFCVDLSSDFTHTVAPDVCQLSLSLSSSSESCFGLFPFCNLPPPIFSALICSEHLLPLTSFVF